MPMVPKATAERVRDFLATSRPDFAHANGEARHEMLLPSRSELIDPLESPTRRASGTIGFVENRES
jgi:hypothetical protein